MNLKNYFRPLVATIAMLFCTLQLAAQTKTVSGVVFDSDGQTPLIGATVMIKGTTNGVSTNVDGTYSIKISGADDVIVFSSLGYDTQEHTAGTRTTLNVTLQQATQKIDDVVVTALGLTRAEKSLGYAVSKISNENLTKTVSSNWVTGLNGKVAGLNMSSAGTGPGGTVRVTLRGDASLNYGNNEALFVVDGVPINSSTVASGSGASYANADAPVDFGNSVTDINPDDIESVSVLKGPAAAALYGSMAGNGVIIITTKQGRADKGLGVSYSGSVTLERAGFWPEFQDQFGPSAVTTSLTNTHFSAWGLPASMTEDGIAVPKQASRYAFGEKFDPSQKRYLYLSKNWDTNEFTMLPWVYADDWFTGIFETGVTYTNTVTVDGNSGKGSSGRFSFTDTRNDWIMPNVGYNQQTYAFAFNQKINKRISLNLKANYVHKESDNMPVSGYQANSPMYGLIWGYTVNKMQAYRDEYFQGRYTMANYLAGANKDSYDIQSSMVFNSLEGHNPYRVLYEETNSLDRDRVYGTGTVNIEILPELTLMLRGAIDMSVDFRQQKKPKMTAGYVNGMYREKTIRDTRFNTDFLLKYSKNFCGDRFALTAAFGANHAAQKYASTTITAAELIVEGPGMYTFANSAVALDPSAYRSRQTTNSLLGFVNLSMDDTYFLDFTARNDWSSTLHPTQWSFFYPSISASALLDRAFKIDNRNINMMKLRVSWANVGNATDPYSLYPTYATTDYPGGFKNPTTIPYTLIKPENTSSWEIGFEGRFFQNRLNFDVALYENVTTDQIVSVKQSAEIGATAMKINAGKIDNKGIEVSFRLLPVRSKNWTWEINGNWSANKNTLVRLTDDWDPATPYQLATSTTIGSRTYVYSFVGQEMYQIYGKDYVRAPEGSYYTDENGNRVDCSGAVIISEKTGYPSLTTAADQHIARVTPRWRAGFGTSITFKNLTASAQFTAQVGGNAFSVTNFALSYQGKLKNSLEGRMDGLVVDGVNAVTDADGNTTYKKNNTITENASVYYNAWKWVRDNTYENTFSTDFLKLKEVRIDYRLPARILDKTKFIRGLSVGFYATNLFCITDWPQFDPEAAGLVNGTNIMPGIETVTFPMTRTYGFNLKLQF